MTDEERVVICQTEIRRLKAVIRDYARAIRNALDIDCRTLFDLWATLDDAEASDEALRLIDASGLAPVDALSFNAFCCGYERALRQIREQLS